jgi:acyl-coenzyme A synthetase/AMP-(fatty) acid ligase/3-hydroxymyristoyl/3-hydroxydecanoyl-(acyl carrier protein) dehydratase
MLDFFDLPGARAPGALAGWRDGEAVRHDAFMLRARAWAGLARRTPGARVALFHGDTIEFASALLGAWQAGKVVWLAADTLPATCASLGRSVDAFFGEFPQELRPLAPAGGDSCTRAWSALDPTLAALVVHTSGTTGEAQAIPKLMSQLTSETANLEAQFGVLVDGADVLSTVSHQHIYGLLFSVLWPLAQGRAMRAQRLDQPEALAAALAERPCVLVASPAHLKRLPGHLDWHVGAGLLRAVFSSGGALTPDESLGVAAILGLAPIEVYGSSESGGIAWRQCRPGAANSWRALPGVEWRIGVDGGVLEVRSPQAGGIGWLRMADRVEEAGDGCFRLHGRSDRIVKIEEKRISLDAIEAALAGSSLVAEARVIVDSQAAGRRQVLAGFVVLSPAGQARLDANGKHALNQVLRALLRQSVEAVAIPRRWRYLERMPQDAQGKTTHGLLSAMLAQDEADEAHDKEDQPARPRLPMMRVIEADAGRVLLELSAPASLLYFDGHFAGAPVLPGVVQVDWAIFYGRIHFALAPVFQGIRTLKFHKVIQPGDVVRLELIHDSAKSSLNFRYFSDAVTYAGGRILFGAG